jgi:hypothetical protein
MESENDTFTIVEYLSVFTAFIYGYVATRFFSGWGAMINFRNSIKFSKEHLFWTILTFGLLIDIWWGSWIKGNFIHNHLLYYISLLPPLVFYLISVILFPPLSDDKFLDLKSYFDRIRRRNYLLVIGLFFTFEFGRHFFKQHVIADMYFNLSAIGFAMVGYFSKSKIIHYGILAAGCVMLVTHIILQEPVGEVTIENFSLTEYLTIFIAFVYGSIASRFFSGWGSMISRFERITFSRDHLLWTFLTFGMLLDFWTGSWPREKFITLNIQYFILSLSMPIAFYALTSVMFPVIRNGNSIDLKAFYKSHRKIMFLLFAITMLANGVTANLMEQKLLDLENVFRVVALALTILALLTTRAIIERFVLIFGCIMLIVHVYIETQFQ